MSTLYERLLDTAKDLIDAYGRPVTLIEKTRTLDATRPWDSTLAVEVETSHNINAVFMEDSSQDLEARLSAVSRLVLSPVEVNESKVMIAAKGLSVTPSTEMEIEDNGRRLAIKRVQATRPGDTALLFTLTVEN